MKKLLLGISFWTLCFSGHAQTSSASRIQQFAKQNYSIQYPNNWQIDTTSKMGTEFFVFSPKENEQDKFRENVNLVRQNLSGQNIDLNKYAEISTKQIKDMATDGKIIESRKIKTGKDEFYKIIFTMTQGVFKLKTEQYYFVKNGEAYVVTFTAEFTKFDKFKIVGEQILNSFSMVK